MRKLKWKELIRGFGFKRCLLICLNLVLILACAASAVGLHVVSSALETTTAAQRFRGGSELRFAQLACYLPTGQGKTEEDILTFRQGLDAKFIEQSLEAPENGSLYTDTYGGSASVTISSDYGSAEVTAMGVGGDFFYFHPLQLRSGSYIAERDLMDDLVVLDEVMAWRLFGGIDLTGLTVYINEEPFVVSGVVAMEDDFATSRARTQEGGVFLSYSALNRLKEGLAIDYYEIVLPDPVSGFAKKLMTEKFPIGSGAIVQNTGRFSVSSLISVMGAFGKRAMTTNGVIYPYWENAARMAESYAALYLLLGTLLAIMPAVCLTIVLVKFITAEIRKGYYKASHAIEDRVEENKRKHYIAGGI